MLKKLFLLGTLVFLAVLIVGGWFGYQAWVHASNTVAFQQRQVQVVAAWQTDPVAIKQASRGKGGVRPGSMSDTMQSHGVTTIQSYASAGTILTVTYVASACETTGYTYDIKRVNGLASILVYADAPWLPDLGGLWRRITGSGGCTAASESAAVKITLDSPLGKDAVVDAASGTSIARKP